MTNIETMANHPVSEMRPSAPGMEDSEPVSTGMTKYNLYYTTSRLHLTIHVGPPSTPTLYYMETQCSLSKLTFLLRRGNTKKSPVVAFAHMSMTSRHMRIGRGDCRTEVSAQMAVEELHRDKNLLARSDYHFGTSEGDERGQRTQFDWRKDRAKWGKTVYDCLAAEGEKVAKLLSGGGLNWKKGAEIEVLTKLDEGLKELLIISALAIWAMEGLNYKSLLQGFSDGDKKHEE